MQYTGTVEHNLFTRSYNHFFFKKLYNCMQYQNKNTEKHCIMDKYESSKMLN